MAKSHGLGVRDVSRTAAPTLVRQLRKTGGAASLILFFVLALCPRSAHGQGTSGTFADPIGLIELTNLLEANAVAYRDAYPAIEAAHVKYLERCAEFRGGQIERFQEEQKQFTFSSVTPTAEQMRKYYDSYITLHRRYATIDQSLFDAVAAAVPDAARARVARARAMRERTIWNPSVMSLMDEIVDVPAIVWRLDWKRVADALTLRQECELALGDYDGRQGKLLRDWLPAYGKMMVAVAESMGHLEVMDPNKMDQVDEEQLKKQMRDTQAAYRKAFVPISELAKLLRASNQRAFRAVWTVLDRSDWKIARSFRREYLSRAYPSIDDGLSSGVEQAANSALRLKSLDNDQRAAIRLIFSQWQTQDDHIVDQMIVKHGQLGLDMAFLSAEDPEFVAVESARQVNEMKRAQNAGNARAALYGVIGAQGGEVLAKLGTPQEAELFLPENEVGLSGVRSGSLIATDGAEVDGSPSKPIGLNIDQRMDDPWMARIAGALGSAAKELAVLHTLKSDYWAEWDLQIKPEAELIEQTMLQKKTVDATGEVVVQVGILTEADVELWVVRAREVEKIRREIEDAFFANVAVVVAAPNQTPIVEMLRVGRICGRPQVGLDSAFDGIPGGEESGNAILAATSVQLPPADCAKIALALAPKLDGLEKSADAMDRARVEFWRVSRLSEIEWQRFAKTSDQSRWGEFYRAMQDREQSMRSSGLKMAQAKAALQRDAFDAIIAAIPVNSRSAVQGAYLRDAYASAYGETEAGLEGLNRARALTDLTEPQRVALTIARDDFMTERDRAVEAMIQMMKGDGPASAPEATREDYSKMQERMEEMARYAFARDAARDKLLSRLKNSLTEEQLRKSGIK